MNTEKKESEPGSPDSSSKKSNSSDKYLSINSGQNEQKLQKDLDFFVQAVSAGIPEQYINPDYRFVRVLKQTKRPFENGWNLEQNLLTIKQVKKDIDSGCNHDFGQAAGFGQVLYVDADTDDQEVRENAILALQEKFPTMKIRTRSGKKSPIVKEGSAMTLKRFESGFTFCNFYFK